MAKLALPTAALLAVSAFGFLSILVLFENNGAAQMIRDSVEPGSTLPDTGEPLRRDYTGVPALDAFLCILVRFFYACASGESPPLSLFTVYFAGQVIASHAILVLEGLRTGNKGTALYYSAFWGLTYQCIPLGVLLPIYCAVHLWRSPLASISRNTAVRTKLEMMSIDPVKLSTVSGAMILGFVVVTTLPAFPAAVITSDTRQAFLALWQIFPLCVSISHRAIALVVRILGLVNVSSDRGAATSIQPTRRAYRQILFLTGLVHLGTMAFIASPQFRQSLFGTSVEPVSFESVFGPMSAFSPRQVGDLAEGVQSLLQYDMYCGFTGAFVWVVALSYIAAGSSVAGAVKTAGKLVLRSLIVGPGGAALWAFWDRDEEMLVDIEGEKKMA